MADRISFMSFLGFPNPFPDSRTIWLFREHMAKTGKDEVVWAELQKQLEAWVCRSSVERYRMPHLLRRIRENQRKHLTEVQRLAIAEMEPGPRKERKAILATSFIKKATSITALFAKLRPPPQRCMIAVLIFQSKEKSSFEIEDISGCLLEVMTLPWCAGQLMRLWESLIKKGTG